MVKNKKIVDANITSCEFSEKIVTFSSFITPETSVLPYYCFQVTNLALFIFYRII